MIWAFGLSPSIRSAIFPDLLEVAGGTASAGSGHMLARFVWIAHYAR